MMKTRSVVLSVFAALLTCAAGCVQPLETVSERPAIGDLSQFYWQRVALAQGVHYTIQGDTPEEHTLTSADGIHITDVSGYSTGTLVIRSNRDSVIVDSISTHTIFLLPPGFAFGSNPPPSALAINGLAELNTGRLVVATNAGVYLSYDRSNWTHASGIRDTVRALAVDSAHDLLFAAAADSLMMSTTRGTTWSLLATPKPGSRILSLATRVDGGLYVGYAGSAGVDYMDSVGSGFQLFVPSQRDVISIATADSASRHRVGVVTDELVTIYNDTGRTLLTSPSYNTSEIRALNSSQMLITAGATLTHIYLFTSSQLAVTISTGSEVLTAALMYQGKYVAGGSNGSIFSSDGGYSKTVTRLSVPITSMIQSRQSDVLVGTTDGLWSFNGTTATRIAGPYADQPKDAAPGLLLLTRINNSLVRGDTWSGGNLYINALRTSVPITARVIDHVDTLYSSAVKAWFGESFVVRYAFETGGTIDPSLPVYWLVYYSKNAGPTIIEEYLSNAGSYALKSRASMLAY